MIQFNRPVCLDKGISFIPFCYSVAADKISFAEALQFGLPAMPQTGIIEITFSPQTLEVAGKKELAATPPPIIAFLINAIACKVSTWGKDI